MVRTDDEQSQVVISTNAKRSSQQPICDLPLPEPRAPTPPDPDALRVAGLRPCSVCVLPIQRSFPEIELLHFHCKFVLEINNE